MTTTDHLTEELKLTSRIRQLGGVRVSQARHTPGCRSTFLPSVWQCLCVVKVTVTMVVTTPRYACAYCDARSPVVRPAHMLTSVYVGTDTGTSVFNDCQIIISGFKSD